MVNYIVCDDNKNIVNNVKNIISRVMMKNETEYQIHSFYDYDQSFKEVITKEMPNKVYILDIETPSASGIDITRRIRNVDYNSIIIFLTAHEELGYSLLKKEYLFLSFINKYDNYENKLANSLKIALKKLNCGKMLKYYNNGVMYNIPVDDIIYVCRDSIERKCLIKTAYIEFLVPKQLNEIKEELNEDFVYSHRSCIVNRDKIRIVDLHKRKIIFDNEESINLLSNSYKKDLMRYDD